MAPWAIYYADGRVVQGGTKADWLAASDEGVQVVVVDGPPPEPRPDRFKTGYVGTGRADRAFYTGVDNYDPLDYGRMKRGSLLPDAAYRAIWERAYGDGDP